MSHIGIDIGTSGIRACAIDDSGAILALCSEHLPLPRVDGDAVSQDPAIWWQGLVAVLKQLTSQIDGQSVQSLAIDGTSGTLLVTDATGTPLADALMYNDSQCRSQARRIANIAPEDSAAHGRSAGLAKLMLLTEHYPQARYALHQADWLAAKLSGRFGISDANNALKTGYDALQQRWPDWLQQLGVDRRLLPEVYRPGQLIGRISPVSVQAFGLNSGTAIVAGTTDSIAAFIATGASQPGEAVTSLGSTLVVKVISERPVYSPQHGIYSHRLGDLWLAGGASNAGGAVLKQFFTSDEMKALTNRLDPQRSTGLDYYPLLRAGERFPVNDPAMQPRLTPRPDDDAEFFQGILESIARIERQAYALLHELGAPYPVSVQTAGGGSANPAWTEIRRNMLGVPVSTAEQSEACYGSALLASRACLQKT